MNQIEKSATTNIRTKKSLKFFPSSFATTNKIIREESPANSTTLQQQDAFFLEESKQFLKIVKLSTNFFEELPNFSSLI